MRAVKETAILPCPALPQHCVVRTLTVILAFKARMKTASPHIILSCCLKSAHSTLYLSIELTSLHHLRCLHEACLPTKHGIRKWRVTWPSGPGVKLSSCQLQACPCWPYRSTSLSPASSMSINKNCTTTHEQVCHPALYKTGVTVFSHMTTL